MKQLDSIFDDDIFESFWMKNYRIRFPVTHAAFFEPCELTLLDKLAWEIKEVLNNETALGRT